MTDTKDLIIPIDPEKAVAIFSDEKEFKNLYAKIEATANALEPDTSTAKGRQEIKSLAYKVTRTRTTLDDMGKKLTESWRKKTEAVNATRSKIKQELSTLSDQVRKPLTEWEEEQAEIESQLNLNMQKIIQLRDCPPGTSESQALFKLDDLKRLEEETDWRDRAETATQLIEATRAVLEAGAAAAREAARLAEENRILRERQAKLEAEEEERLAKARQEEAERIRKEEEQAAEIARLEREKKEAEEAEEKARREKLAAEEREALAKKNAEIKAAQEKKEAATKKKRQAEARERFEAQVEKMKAETTDDLYQLIGNSGLAEEVCRAITAGEVRNVVFGE